MSSSSRRLVFTDLDGSLLDHETYSFEPARPLLAQLASAGIPVVPVTSKTRVEIESLRLQMNNQHPFIVENGAAVFMPQDYFATPPPGAEPVREYWVKAFSEPRQRWLDMLQTLQSQFAGEFVHFHATGPAGIARMTGLSLEQAALANQRDYSEPVKWLGSSARREEFIGAIAARGGRCLQGGRFLTIAGDCDKGRALKWLRDVFCQSWQVTAVNDIAAGDSDNDVAMLEAAGSALLVRSPAHNFPQLRRDRDTLKSTYFGPNGWVEGVEQWLAMPAQPAH